LGKRSRKRSGQPAPAKPAARREHPRNDAAPTDGEPAPPKKPSRSEAKDAAAREALVPLAEGERPRAVTAAALFALSLALVQVVLYLAGQDLAGGDEESSIIGSGLFVAVMLAAAWGCWRMRYWAVLGMQALLALIILFFFLAATRISSFIDVVIVVGFIVPSSVLFWHLVKAMARIQMPERRPSQ
jgi:hypothetical protein